MTYLIPLVDTERGITLGRTELDLDEFEDRRPTEAEYEIIKMFAAREAEEERIRKIVSLGYH